VSWGQLFECQQLYKSYSTVHIRKSTVPYDSFRFPLSQSHSPVQPAPDTRHVELLSK